jgi:hypothetical protein
MAIASPEDLKKMQNEIPQVNEEGTIISSKKIDGSFCLPRYESVVKTDQNEIAFRYSVNKKYCSVIVDGLYDNPSSAFKKNSVVSVNLTKEEPPILISYSTISTPYPFATIAIIAAIIISALMIVRHKRQSKNLNN